MADERIVIRFETENVPRTRNEIDSLQQNAIGGFTELLSSFELFETALAGVQSVASGLYGLLIDSNEKLNAELLKSQTNLASNLKIYRDGTEIVDITEKITATQETLRQSLKQIEEDTKSLVGVTTDQVNGVFQVLLQNSQKFIGQSKEFSDPIEAATASTKNWAAALGTLGIPLEQANQEIRSILQGDVNNPDSIIAKTLQISREQYDQWVANGELIDQLNSKLEVFTAGNALASKSIAGVTSNLQSLVEDTARLVGAPLLEPIVKSLNEIYSILNSNIDLIEDLAGDNVQQLVELIDQLRDSVALVAESLDINPEGFLKSGSELIGNLITATTSLIALGGELVALVGNDLSQAFSTVTTVANLTLEGITKLANLLTTVTKGVGDFLDRVGGIPGLNLGKAFTDAQTGVAKLTGEFDQSIEAVQTYASITDVLLAQTDKLTKTQGASADQIKGQIEQLEAQKRELQQVKTYREEDAKAVESQVTAINKAIASLEGMSQATSELTFKSKELEDLGNIYESLAAKAEAALRQIQNEGSGDATVFKDSVDALTELTEKQVEYGQITITEAQERLEAILNNNKVEIEQREAALNTLKALEQDFTDFKVAQLQAEIDAIAVATQTGQVSEREGLDQTYAKENQQLLAQIALIDSQIARNAELGLSVEKLTVDKENLLNEQLKAQVAYGEDVNKLQQEEADRYYETALSTIERTETERTIALTQGLLDRSITEEKFNQQSLEATRATLQAKLELERSNQAALEATLASANTVDQQRAIQKQIDDSKIQSANLTKQLVETELQAREALEQAQQEEADRRGNLAAEETQRQQEVTQAVREGVASREQAISDSFDQQELRLLEATNNEAEYQAGLTELNRNRLKAQIEAERETQRELAAIGDTEGVEASIRKQTQLKISLIQSEKRAELDKAKAVQEATEERLSDVEDEFTFRELALRQSTKSEEAYQAGLTKLNIDRIKAQLEAEKAAQRELAAIGDTEGVQASKVRSAKLAIDLINQQISAEKKLQDTVKAQLEDYKKRLELQQQSANVSLLNEEVKLQQAVVAGTITKEQAELAKLEITKRRVQEELKVLRQLEGQGDEAEQLANQEAIARAKLEELEVTQQIQEYGKSNVNLADQVTQRYEAQISKQTEIAANVAHINQLFDLQAQSVQRVNELRASQVNLANAQIATLSTGLGNELSLTEKSLQARQKLTQVQQQLADQENLTAEERTKLVAEETALKAQLNVLGENGQKTEKELLIQKQQIQQQQLQAQQAQFEIEKQQQTLLLEQQRAGIELDLVKANNKAEEISLEAELLAIKADQLRAEAAVTEDVNQRNKLLQQASAIDNQSARTLELAKAQTKAAQQEAEVKSQLIDQQEAINSLQNEAKQDSLDTQKTLLDAQQAYEASLEGIEPSINTKALDDFTKKLDKVKRQFEDAIDVKNIPVNVNLPVTVSPANLDVRVTDNSLSSSVNKLSSTLGSQTSTINSVRTTVSGLGGKLDALKRAVETTNSGGSSGGATVTKPVVNTSLTVNVDKSGKVTVDTASLLGERASEGGCQG